jgi:2-hydroxychromene-2-carboxylate isomerase
VLALAASDQTMAMLQTETGTARALSIFGAPTFVAGEEGRRSIERCYCVASADRLKTLA